MSSSDECALGCPGVAAVGSARSAVHPGPRRREEQLLTRGPLVLAVLIATPSGRWSSELSGKSPEARSARALLSAVCPGPPATESRPGARVVGVAVVEGWRFILGPALHEHTLSLIQADMAHWHRRSGQQFLDHRVLAATQLSQVMPGTEDLLRLGPHGDSGPARAVGDDILGRLLGQPRSMLAARTDSEGPHALRNALCRWEERLGSASTVAWPALAPLACAMASGSWPGDVSVCFRRGGRVNSCAAPTRPSERMISHVLRMHV